VADVRSSWESVAIELITPLLWLFGGYQINEEIFFSILQLEAA